MNPSEYEVFKVLSDIIKDRFYKIKPVYIDGIEVTQSIQYYHSADHLTDAADQAPDNSARLVSGKPAWVRVYVRCQSYLSEVPNVTGTLEVSQRVFGFLYGPPVIFNPEPPGDVTARHDPLYDLERGTIGYSLNFIIPADNMYGHLKLKAKITEPGGETFEHEVYIDATLQQTLHVRGIMVGYNGPQSSAPNAPNLTLAAPALADLQTTSAWTLLIYPVRSWATFSSGGTITWNLPLTDSPSCSGCCTPNWVALNSSIQAQKVADGNLAGVLYYGLMAAGIPMGPIIGCNSGGVSSGSNGNQETMAHELGHACGLPHSPCGVTGDANFPVYEPYDTGGTAHAFIGEYGLDISNGIVKPPAAFKDWMSYCGPRWISLYNYSKLIDNSNLDPKIVGEDHPWFHEEYELNKWPWPPDPYDILRRKYVVGDPEPVISIIGIMHADDVVEVTSVMRLEAIRQVPTGREMDLRAELIGRGGKAAASAPLYRLPSWGNGCSGCSGEQGNQGGFTPYIFQIFLPDAEPGDALRIHRFDKDVWYRKAPPDKPSITLFEARTGEKGEFMASIKVERETEEDEYWIQWSGDRGKTWHALATQFGPGDVLLQDPGLPSGTIYVRLLAGNGFYTAISEQIKVQVPEKAPVIAILTPRLQQSFVEGQTMRLWGMASLPSGTHVKIQRATWTIDGKEAAAGLDAYIKAPKRGKHKLTLAVRYGNKKAQNSMEFVTHAAQRR